MKRFTRNFKQIKQLDQTTETKPSTVYIKKPIDL